MPGKKICHRPGAGRHGRRGTAGKRERGGGLSGEGLSDEHHLNKVLKAMRQEPRKIWETVFQGQQQARALGPGAREPFLRGPFLTAPECSLFLGVHAFSCIAVISIYT